MPFPFESIEQSFKSGHSLGARHNDPFTALLLDKIGPFLRIIREAFKVEDEVLVERFVDGVQLTEKFHSLRVVGPLHPHNRVLHASWPVYRNILDTMWGRGKSCDDLSVYDIERAVKDGATVPIYYESRLAKLKLDDRKKPKLDAEFEEATEGEETEHKEKLKTKWAALEAVVGADGADGAGRGRHREALGRAAPDDGRQGDDRLHEPAHLHRPLQRDL